MEGSDSQIKTLLGTGLKRHGTDLSEFVERFYIKSVCNCAPYLGGRKKILIKNTFPYLLCRFTEE